MVGLHRTPYSLQSCYSLLNRHILYRLMNDRCFIHGDSVHSSKHIPGFMKKVQDGSWKFEKNEDWLKPQFHCLQMKRWFWHPVDVWDSYPSKPIPNKWPPVMCQETLAPSYNLCIPVWWLAYGESFNYEEWSVLTLHTSLCKQIQQTKKGLQNEKYIDWFIMFNGFFNTSNTYGTSLETCFSLYSPFCSTFGKLQNYSYLVTVSVWRLMLAYQKMILILQYFWRRIIFYIWDCGPPLRQSLEKPTT